MAEFPPLTDEEKSLHDTYFAPEGFVLMRAMLRGTPVAVVSHMAQDEHDDYFIHPIAILVTDEVMSLLDPGEGAELVVLEPEPQEGGDSDDGSGQASGGSQHPGHGS